MFNFKHLFQNNTDDHSADEQVKLDGSNIARLINMRAARAQKCACPRCGDLLSRIRFNGALTLQEHERELSALHFWNVPGHEQSQSSVSFHSTPTISEVALNGITNPSEVMGSLMDAESKWQAAETKSCVDVESDQFWLNHYKSFLQAAETQSE